MARYLLFTMPSCPNCSLIKAFLEDKKIEFEEIDAATDEGLEKAAELNVLSTPTFIVLDKEGKESSRANSVEEVQRIVKNKSLTEM